MTWNLVVARLVVPEKNKIRLLTSLAGGVVVAVAVALASPTSARARLRLHRPVCLSVGS